MRRHLRPGRIAGTPSASVAIVWLLVLGQAGRGQDDRADRPSGPAAGGIAAGTVVVLEAPDLMLRDDRDGHPVPARPGTDLEVERVDGDRLLVRWQAGSRRGWVGGDQVVPLDRAMEHFDRAIERDSRDVDSYRMRGRLHAARGEFDAALADFDQAIPLMPGRSRAFVDRGGLEARRGQLDRAIDDYSEALRLDPKDAETYAARGDARTARGEFPRAIADYTEALKLDPRRADLYSKRGQACMKNHDTAKAIANYNAALELDPRNPSTYVMRGQAWSRRGDHAPAMEDFDAAIRLAPYDAGAYIARATEWEKDLKMDPALADYQQAIALDHRAVAAYEGRGRIWRKGGQYELFLSNFNELIRLVPDDSRGHRALAWMLATCDRDSIRDGRLALAESKKACELTKWADPDCIEALAAACAEVGDFNAAAGWQAHALRLFTAKSDKIDRRIVAKKTQDAEMNHRLHLYKKSLPYHEQSDRAVR